MRYFTPRIENSCFALVHREFPPNNVDAETLPGMLQFKSNCSRLAVQRGVARPTGPLHFEGSEGLSALRVILLPVTDRG